MFVEYTGVWHQAEDIADSLIEEGKAAVRSASSAAELSSIPTARADGSNGPLVLGFFNRSDVEESEKEGSGPYTVFLSAADQLRGYATFVTGGMGLMVDYDIKNRPAVVYVGDKGEKGEPQAEALLVGMQRREE